MTSVIRAMEEMVVRELAAMPLIKIRQPNVKFQAEDLELLLLRTSKCTRRR